MKCNCSQSTIIYLDENITVYSNGRSKIHSKLSTSMIIKGNEVFFINEKQYEIIKNQINKKKHITLSLHY